MEISANFGYGIILTEKDIQSLGIGFKEVRKLVSDKLPDMSVVVVGDFNAPEIEIAVLARETVQTIWNRACIVYPPKLKKEKRKELNADIQRVFPNKQIGWVLSGYAG